MRGREEKKSKYFSPNPRLKYIDNDSKPNIYTIGSVHQNGANFQVKFKPGAAPGNDDELISAVNSISDVDAFVDRSTGMRYRDDLKTAKTAKVCGECF